jgi:archaellum component FlaC
MKLNKKNDAYEDLIHVLENGFNDWQKLSADIKSSDDDFKNEVNKLTKKYDDKNGLKTIDFYNQDYLIKYFLHLI